MVDFSLSTLICDADEPRARFPRLLPPPPKGKTPPPTPPPHLHLWMGSLEKKEKKIKFGFWGLAFQMVLRLIWWGWGGRWESAYWYPFSCKNREVKGHYQLFVEGEPEGGWPWPLSTPEIILNAVTCEVRTAHTSFVGVGVPVDRSWYSNYLQSAT